MDGGLVKIIIEAYVVNGMTMPFILGNNFANQYSISIIRKEGECHLDFGRSQRHLKVESLVDSAYLADQGLTFKVRVIPNFAAQNFRIKIHCKNQKNKRKQRLHQMSAEVHAVKRTVIPPMTSKLTMVETYFSNASETLFVERKILCSGHSNNVFGSPDSMISVERPYLHVSNFSNMPVTVAEGQVLGIARNPCNWLDQKNMLSKEFMIQMETHADLI